MKRSAAGSNGHADHVLMKALLPGVAYAVDQRQVARRFGQRDFEDFGLLGDCRARARVHPRALAVQHGIAVGQRRRDHLLSEVAPLAIADIAAGGDGAAEIQVVNRHRLPAAGLASRGRAAGEEQQAQENFRRELADRGSKNYHLTRLVSKGIFSMSR